MKVTYKGMPHALPPKIQQKLDAKFAKIAKLLDGRGEREAHVIVTQERRMCCAEITAAVLRSSSWWAAATDADLFTALSKALEKLDAQAVKQRAKWRTTHRRKELVPPAEVPAEAPPIPRPARQGAGRVRREADLPGEWRRPAKTHDAR